mgnify:CR=1 FL=1
MWSHSGSGQTTICGSSSRPCDYVQFKDATAALLRGQRRRAAGRTVHNCVLCITLQSRHGNERALNVVVQLGLWRWVSPMMRKKPILRCSAPHRKELFKSVSTERRSSLRIALYRCADVAYGNAHFQDIFSLTRGASAVLKDFADGLRGFLSGKNHILHQFQDSRRMPIDNVTCRSGFKP